jgi:hypothetical protein
MGKNDYEAVTSVRDDSYFKEALGIDRVPSAEILRQRFDQDADILKKMFKTSFPLDNRQEIEEFLYPQLDLLPWVGIKSPGSSSAPAECSGSMPP